MMIIWFFIWVFRILNKTLIIMVKEPLKNKKLLW